MEICNKKLYVLGYGFDGDSGYNTLKKTEFKILLKNYEKLLVGNHANQRK